MATQLPPPPPILFSDQPQPPMSTPMFPAVINVDLAVMSSKVETTVAGKRVVPHCPTHRALFWQADGTHGSISMSNRLPSNRQKQIQRQNCENVA